MRKTIRRRRCPHCRSLDTRRHGKKVLKEQQLNRCYVRRQRWYCKQCGRTFMPMVSRNTTGLSQRAVGLYFDTGASYRGVARAFNVRPMTAYQRVIQVARNSKSPLEVSLGLRPKWPGYLVVDGNSVRVGDHRESLLLGVDSHSQDIPHALLATHEDGYHWTRFFRVLKDRLNLIPKGIVTDGDPAVILARRTVFPQVPWQLCVRHFQKDLELFLRYRFTQRRGHWRHINRFLTAVHRLLYASNYQEAHRRLMAISMDPGYQKAGFSNVLSTLRERFAQLVTHHFHEGMPRTTNIAEGAISRLDSKINRADGYGSHETCWATMKLLITWCRFKKFTDCRKNNKHKNGKSPLELAGVDTSKINWIKFSQRSL